MEGLEILELYFRTKALIDFVKANGYVSKKDIFTILGITDEQGEEDDK